MTDDTIRREAFTIREWVKAHSVPVQTLYHLLRASETFRAACGDPAVSERGRSEMSRLGWHNRGFETEAEARIAPSIEETGKGGARGAAREAVPPSPIGT